VRKWNPVSPRLQRMRIWRHGDRKWNPLNDGQIPNLRVVRVALGTGSNPRRANRRASRSGPRELISHPKNPTSPHDSQHTHTWKRFSTSALHAASRMYRSRSKRSAGSRCWSPLYAASHASSCACVPVVRRRLSRRCGGVFVQRWRMEATPCFHSCASAPAPTPEARHQGHSALLLGG
jgi:hypothetical protein